MYWMYLITGIWYNITHACFSNLYYGYNGQDNKSYLSIIDEDMEDYIYWFVSGHRSFVGEIKLRVTLEECEDIQKEDAYIDWIYCSWSFFKNLRTMGAFYNNNKSKQEDIVTSSSTH